MSLKEQIKIALIKRNMTLTQLHNELIKRYNKTDSLQNLSNKIKRESLKYEEIEEIATILNYKIEWIDKSQKA